MATGAPGHGRSIGPRRAGRSSAILAALWLSPAVAAADSLPAPPADCPPGSEGRTSHAGTYCAAISCERDADCEGGRVCREHALCVRRLTVTYNTYSVRNVERTLPVVIGACAAGPSECPPDAAAHIGYGGAGRDVDEAHPDEWARVEGPARCLTERRCIEPPDSAPGPSGDHEVASSQGAGTASSSGREAAGAPASQADEEDEDEEGGGCVVGSSGSAAPWGLLSVLCVALVLGRRRSPAER